MRLALQEFIILGVRRTFRFRPSGSENHCQTGQKLFALVRDENKRPRHVFSTSEAFHLQEKYTILFPLKRRTGISTHDSAVGSSQM